MIHIHKIIRLLQYILQNAAGHTLYIIRVLYYLASWTFLYRANNSLSRQLNQDIGAVIIQGHIVAIKRDQTQVRHHSATT